MNKSTDNISPDLLALERVFEAAPEQVFKAWTDPDSLRQWWGPPGSQVLSAEVDLRIGGRYRLEVQPPQRGVYAVYGTYQEIDRPEKLVFTWRWERPDMDIGESLVEIQIHVREGLTELTLTHARLPGDEARALHREGWVGILDQFEQYLKKTSK